MNRYRIVGLVGGADFIITLDADDCIHAIELLRNRLTNNPNMEIKVLSVSADW